MASIDDVPATQPPDPDEDPYHVYTLRRPHERASSVVPQLPKQPEMAETRLRYRRIPAAARSGSFGSLGGHFPARFQFPTRRSLLESLTSDDESVSFSLNQKPRPKIARKRRRRVRATKGRFPSPDSILHDFAISDDDSVDDEYRDDDGSDDEDEEKQIDFRNSAKGKKTLMSPKHSPPRIVYSKSGKPPMLRKSSKKALSPSPKFNYTNMLSSPPPSPPASSVASASAVVSASAVASASASAPAASASARASTSARASRSADEISIDSSSLRDNATVRASKSADSAQMSRRIANVQPIHQRPKHVVPTVLDPARTSAVPVTILPPQAMSEQQRQNFVLMPEEPVLVTRGGRSDGGAKKKKNHRKKGDKASSKKECKESRRRQGSNMAANGLSNVIVEERKDRDELGGLRDKELSVSFAHQRFTAEQAAAKPLNAVQRLLHMLAFVRIGGGRRSSHRR